MDVYVQNYANEKGELNQEVKQLFQERIYKIQLWSEQY